jgi:hypothetical protein
MDETLSPAKHNGRILEVRVFDRPGFCAVNANETERSGLAFRRPPSHHTVVVTTTGTLVADVR